MLALKGTLVSKRMYGGCVVANEAVACGVEDKSVPAEAKTISGEVLVPS